MYARVHCSPRANSKSVPQSVEWRPIGFVMIILPSKLRSFIFNVTPTNDFKVYGGILFLPLSLDFLSPPTVDTNFSLVISSTAPECSVLILYSFAFLLSTSIIYTAVDHGCYRCFLGHSAAASCFSSEHHHSNYATSRPLRRVPRQSGLRRRSKYIWYLDLLHYKVR